MNTRQTPNLGDLYEENRRDVEVSTLDPAGMRAELMSMIEEKGGQPAQPQSTTPASEGGDDSDSVPVPVSPMIAPNPVDVGVGPSQLYHQEEERKSLAGRAVDTFTWLTSPFVALADAGLAPMAHQYESEGFLGQTKEAFQVSGDAFLNRMFPEYGQEHEMYGQQIVENVMPGAPDSIKAAAATSLEIIADPSIALGLGAVKVVQRGLQAGRTMEAGKGGFRGVWQEGISEVLTFGKGFDETELANITDLAKRADEGDKRAILKLNEVLSENEAVQDAVTKLDDGDVEAYVSKLAESFGDVKGAEFTTAKGPTPDELLGETLTTNNQTRAGNINLSRLNTEEDIDNLLLKVQEVYGQDFRRALETRANRKIVADAQNEQLSELLGRKVTEFSPEQAYAIRQLLVSSSHQLNTLAKKADLAGGKGIEMLAFEKGLAVHRAIQAKATGVAAHAGRLLQSYNIVASDSRQAIRQIQEMVANQGDDKFTQNILAKLMAATEDPSALNKIINKSAYQKTVDGLYEVYVNAILSGPTTHMINVTSNAFMVGMRPTESIVQGMSAAARFNFSEASKNFGEATAMLHGAAQGLADGIKLMTRKESIQSLGLPEEVMRAHELAKSQIRPSITAQELGVRGKLGYAVDKLGTVVRLPGHLLLAEDIGFKLIHNRMTVNAEAARKAMNAGVDTQTTRKIYNTLRANPDEFTRQTADDAMKYYTFTKELGDIGTKAHKLIQATPAKILIPFFRTPMNIVKMGVRHSVLGGIFKDLKPALTRFDAAGDRARAKLAMGTMVPGIIIGMLDENITGNIDMETPSGRFKAQMNIPPYSVKIGSKWYSYERIEPVRTILGLMVGYRDAIMNIEPIDPETGMPNNMAEEALTAAVAPFIKTMEDNYMLPTVGSIINMVEGVGSGNYDYTMRQFNRMAASAIPYSNFMRQTNQGVFDDTYRISEGIIDNIQSMVPGLSKELPPRRTIWGDEQHVPDGLFIDTISPIKTGNSTPSPMEKDLIDLEVAIPGQPREITVEGTGIKLELTPQQQSTFSEIRGKGVEGSPSLREIMTMMHSDPMFQALPDEIRKERYKFLFDNATEMTKKYMLATDQSLQHQYRMRMQSKLKVQEMQR